MARALATSLAALALALAMLPLPAAALDVSPAMKTLVAAADREGTVSLMFGEGALSASFIPVYAALVGRGDRAEADRVAGAVGSLLALVVSGLVIIAVIIAAGGQKGG